MSHFFPSLRSRPSPSLPPPIFRQLQSHFSRNHRRHRGSRVGQGRLPTGKGKNGRMRNVSWFIHGRIGYLKFFINISSFYCMYVFLELYRCNALTTGTATTRVRRSVNVNQKFLSLIPFASRTCFFFALFTHASKANFCADYCKEI